MTLVYTPIYLPPSEGETIAELVGRYKERMDFSTSEAINVIGQQAGLITSDVITPENSMTQDEFNDALDGWAPGGLGDGYEEMIASMYEEE